MTTGAPAEERARTVQVRLPAALLSRLDATLMKARACARYSTRLNRSNIIRQALVEYLDRVNPPPEPVQPVARPPVRHRERPKSLPPSSVPTEG